MKTATSWSDSTDKQPVQWAGADKPQAIWSGSSTKPLTVFTETGKNKDAWDTTAPETQAVAYDDGRFTYDDPLLFFDSRPNTNTDNQRLQTVWSAT